MHTVQSQVHLGGMRVRIKSVYVTLAFLGEEMSVADWRTHAYVAFPG